MLFFCNLSLYTHILYLYFVLAQRQVCRSLIDKTQRRFNVSIAEIDTQDTHQTLTIGIAVVSGDAAHRQRMLDEIIRFMEVHADAELTSIET